MTPVALPDPALPDPALPDLRADVSHPAPVSKASPLLRGGRIVAMASVLAVAPMVTGLPQFSVDAPPPAHSVRSELRHVGLVKSSVASLRTAKNATGSAPETPGAADPISTARSAAMTPAQNVAGPVTVVGVTWPKGAASPAAKYQIRTLTNSAWSQWQSLDAADGSPDGAEAAAASAAVAAKATTGTEPYVVTGASKYEVRSLTTDSKVPAAATVQAVDPGTSTADNAQPSAALAPGAASAATVKPVIYPRSAWGADENLRKAPPVYGQVLFGFVHHTDSANSYTAAEVPAMIRGMYAYHVQSLGWDDIGYNFLVDRFGRTWEGRYGGMDKPVVGAQTLNYNQWSMGVSAIGNFDVAPVPQAMTNAFKSIFAWKFSLAHIPAIGTVPSPRPPSWSAAPFFQRIAGHRDGYQTACPGQYLYAKLAEIRAGAAAIMGAPAGRPVVKPPVRRVVKPPVKRVVRPVAPPWMKTRYTPYKSVVLIQGRKGTAVVMLQRGLRVTADGAFGPMTRASLVAFQKQQRIAVNGVVRGQVWDRLEKRDYPLIAYRRLTLRQGSKGAVVVVAQRALRLPADGAFGPKTAAAVKAVQRLARLPQTGVVSGMTWVAIEARMHR